MNSPEELHGVTLKQAQDIRSALGKTAGLCAEAEYSCLGFGIEDQDGESVRAVTCLKGDDCYVATKRREALANGDREELATLPHVVELSDDARKVVKAALSAY